MPMHMNSVSLSPEVSLIHASDLPDHSVSTHLVGPGRRFITLPLSATDFRSFPVEASPLVGRLADLPGRIEFVILRTDRSPPVAPHPASRRRSYIRLQAGERMPEEDFHLSDQLRSQAHQPSLPRLGPVFAPFPAFKRRARLKRRCGGGE